MNAPFHRRTDIVVIGAGAAGLYAARELKRAGKRVLLLEARDRVGGRTLSETIGGVTIDLGGQWVGPTQSRVHQLIAEYGLSTFPTFCEGDSVLWMKGERAVHSAMFPSPNPEIGAELEAAFATIDAVGATIPLETPWMTPGAAELDGKSFYTWVRETVQSEFARFVFDSLAATLFSSDPRDLSFLHVAAYIAAAGGFETITQTAGGAQDRRFVTGFQDVSKRMAAELEAELILSSPVFRIQHDAKGAVVHAEKATIRCSVNVIPDALLRTKLSEQGKTR